MSSEELLQKDAQFVIRAWTGVAEPTPVVQGRGAILVDPEGREYIDCSSGLFAVNVGHSRPEVVAAVKDQVEKVIQVSVLQTTEPMVRLAERVAQLTPAPLQKSY
ncbi:MAG: aminotransferase class III-fold pyridoxal phosphate-dependent enzyme, partial [Anaerolineae bacterium]|nr:aminotransferase class III-fold pyridoxal phosphate-dependent enzyme [Anaerolineae bacterium]